MPWVLCAEASLHYQSVFLSVKFLFKVILYLIITSAIIASTKWLQISISNHRNTHVSRRFNKAIVHFLARLLQYKGWIIGATNMSGIAAVVIQSLCTKPYCKLCLGLPY